MNNDGQKLRAPAGTTNDHEEKENGKLGRGSTAAEHNSDQMVPYNANIAEPVLSVDERGNINIQDVYKTFTQEGCKPLIKSQMLVARLQESGYPFGKIAGVENPGRYVFLSYLWDRILETNFLRGKKPSEEIQMISKTFIGHLQDFNEETQFERFASNVAMTEQYGVGQTKKAFWYDLPAVLRVLAPTNETLVNANAKILASFCSRIMMNLPHSVIMMPWREFEHKHLVEVEDANKVSTPCYVLIHLPSIANSTLSIYVENSMCDTSCMASG